MKLIVNFIAATVMLATASLAFAVDNQVIVPDCAGAGHDSQFCRERGTESQMMLTRKAMNKRAGGTLGHIAGVHGSTQSLSALKHRDAQKTPTEKQEDQKRQELLQGEGSGKNGGKKKGRR